MPIWRGLFTRICVQRCLAIPLKAYMKLLVHAFYCLTPETGLIIDHNNQNNKKSTKMKTLRYIGIAIFAVVMCVNFAACSSDDDEEEALKEHDPTLYDEWIENSSKYIVDYYCFYKNGTGSHGSYEPGIDWVTADDDFTWYTVNNKYIYINGHQHEYSCDGSTFEIVKNGKTKSYHSR